MRATVLDTSVIIKWFHRSGEEDADAAMVLRDAYLDGDIKVIVPDLLIYEFANALKFKTKLKPADTAKMIKNLWALGLSIQPVEQSLADAMIDLAYRYKLTIYDAAFVSLARQAKAYFITADRKLYESIRELEGVAYLADIVE